MGVNVGWAVAFATCNLLFLAAAAFRWFALPKPDQSRANVSESESASKQLQSQFSKSSLHSSLSLVLPRLSLISSPSAW